VIALSCGIKISAVHCLVLSQSTRLADDQTDRITTPKTALSQLRRAVKIKPKINLEQKYRVQKEFIKQTTRFSVGKLMNIYIYEHFEVI